MDTAEQIISLIEALTEGLNDKFIFKAVFLAGGPGAGKTFIVKKLFSGLGLKFINSDTNLERLAKQAGIDLKKELFSVPVQQVVRPKAKEITKKQLALAQSGKLGLIIDGTGSDFKSIEKAAKMLQDRGYDVSMVFVNTSLEVAQKRNAERDRVLDKKEVEKLWASVQSNIGKFQSLFKRDFLVVDNSKSVDAEEFAKKVAPALASKGIKLINKPIRNPLAKKWIENEIVKRTGQTNPKLLGTILANK